MSGLPQALVVFGASGFVGRNFVDALAGKVEHLVGVNGSGTPVPGCTQTVAMDRLADLGALPADTAVVHLAAFRYDSQRFDLAQSDIIAANAALNTRVYQFAAERGIREVRAASSVAVYPADLAVMDDAVPIDLNKPPHANEAFYAWSKRFQEILADLHKTKFGIETIAFRLSNPYGAYDSINPGKAHVAPAFVMKALDKAPVFAIRGDPNVERDFTFVGDVVDVFTRSLGFRGRHETYNLCTGGTTTLMDLARTVLSVAGVDKPIQAGAPGAFGPAARRSTADRLKAAFDFRPTSLADGMAKTIEWYRDAFKP